MRCDPDPDAALRRSRLPGPGRDVRAGALCGDRRLNARAWLTAAPWDALRRERSAGPAPTVRPAPDWWSARGTAAIPDAGGN